MADEGTTAQSATYLRVHQFLAHSRANGPGVRAVLWVQGCTLGCSGCFNEPTHSTKGGEMMSVKDLVEQIVALGDTIEGITISGGEPLQQRARIAELLRQIKAQTALSVILFTGFSWEELEQIGRHEANPAGELPLALLKDVDILIAGRFDKSKLLARDLRGSSNKLTYFLTDRYNEQAMQSVPPAEVVITPQGEVIMSGIDPLIWKT
jgi:anaerobic ribonucleoside-triphosphate reductase activating protein